MTTRGGGPPSGRGSPDGWKRLEPPSRRATLVGVVALVIVVTSALLLLEEEASSPAALSIRANAQPAALAPSASSPSVPVRREVTVHRDLPYQQDLTMDVWSPPGRGPWPVAVFLHGRSKDRASYHGLMRRLVGTGTVVYNATWHDEGPQYPEEYVAAARTIACAVRFARATAPHFSGRPQAVTLVGHDLGASMGALLALSGDPFAGPCPNGSGDAQPESFVGIAGNYDDVSPLPGPALNPALLQGGDRRVLMLFVHGTEDAVSPVAWVRRFRRALDRHGYVADLLLAPETRHENVTLTKPGLAAILRALDRARHHSVLKAASERPTVR